MHWQTSPRVHGEFITRISPEHCTDLPLQKWIMQSSQCRPTWSKARLTGRGKKAGNVYLYGLHRCCFLCFQIWISPISLPWTTETNIPQHKYWKQRCSLYCCNLHCAHTPPYICRGNRLFFSSLSLRPSAKPGSRAALEAAAAHSTASEPELRAQPRHQSGALRAVLCWQPAFRDTNPPPPLPPKAAERVLSVASLRRDERRPALEAALRSIGSNGGLMSAEQLNGGLRVLFSPQPKVFQTYSPREFTERGITDVLMGCEGYKKGYWEREGGVHWERARERTIW